jgi:hypothetical protein
MTAEYDIHRKSYKYSIDDWQLLANILHEYTDKLVGLSRQLSKKKNAIYFRPLTILSIEALLLATAYNLAGQAIIQFISSPIFVVIVSNIVVVNTRELIFGKDTKDLIRSLEKNASLMSFRLESAIKLTIAVSDQVEISLAKKLEMDLHIDEAISALDYYYSVVGAKKASLTRSSNAVGITDF